DVPDVSPDMRHLLYAAVVGGVEAMIHAGSEAQGGVASVAVELRQIAAAEQVFQRIPGPLQLQQVGAGDRATGADDGVARADKDARIRIDRSGAFPELPGEA